MKNRVNLYEQKFRPTLELLSLNFTIAVWVTSLVLVLFIGFNIYQTQKSVEREALAAAKELADKTAVMDVLVDGKNNKTQDAALISELEQTQKQLAIKKSIISELANREEQRSRGFSALMFDLANNHQPELWLTEINLDGKQIKIKGGAVDSTALPLWVNQLSSANYFIGTEFAAARLFRDENEQLQFVLSSDAGETEQGGEVDER